MSTLFLALAGFSFQAQSVSQPYTIRRPELETETDFRSRIRKAAEAGPNFARDSAVVAWSCGFVCAELAIVKGQSSAVYRAPFSVSDCRDQTGPLIQIERNSDLLVLDGFLELEDGSDTQCGRHVYRWNGSKLVKVSFTPHKKPAGLPRPVSNSPTHNRTTKN